MVEVVVCRRGACACAAPRRASVRACVAPSRVRRRCRLSPPSVECPLLMNEQERWLSKSTE